MNLLELQTRANALVQKVNEYEETIAGVELDENEILNEHTYVDLFSLRMIMHRLFGKTPSDRSSSLTTTDGVTWYYMPTSKGCDIHYGNINENSYTYGSSLVPIGRANDNNDLYTNYNLQVIDPNLSNADYYTETTGERERLITSMTYTVFGADIRDALVTESQTANIFKWNTTSEDDVTSYASAYVVPQQVPGIVCYYLGSGYDGTYTATVPFNTSYSTNQPNNATPALYGAYYIDQNVGPGPSGITSQQAENRGAEGLRMFMPGLTYFNGTSISPINIWQPFPRLDTNYGYNYQGKALYHELVFKRRRAGCKEAGLDFIPDATVDNGICDNDPQGLAMRLALAQQKPYYYNRPWFKELDEYYSEAGTKQAQLADLIIEKMEYEVTNYDYSAFTQHGSAVINTTTGECTGFTLDGDDYIGRSNTLTSGEVSSFSGTFRFSVEDVGSSLTTSVFKFDNPSTSGIDSWYLLYFQNKDEIRLYMKDADKKSIVLSAQWTSGATGVQDIFVKYNYDGTTYTYQISTDKGLTWSQPEVITPSNTNKPVTPQYDLMIGAGNNYTSIKSFNLKDFEFTVNGQSLAPVISTTTETMTDNEFYNEYQLDYDTYAEALGEPL